MYRITMCPFAFRINNMRTPRVKCRAINNNVKAHDEWHHFRTFFIVSSAYTSMATTRKTHRIRANQHSPACSMYRTSNGLSHYLYGYTRTRKYARAHIPHRAVKYRRNISPGRFLPRERMFEMRRGKWDCSEPARESRQINSFAEYLMIPE